MANTVVFNRKTEGMKNALCFEDLKVGDIFMYKFLDAHNHFIKVKDSVSSAYNSNVLFNAICIEDGDYNWFEKGEKVKKFLGEVALNGVFVEFVEFEYEEEF